MESRKVNRLASLIGLAKHMVFRQPKEDRSKQRSALFNCMLIHVHKV